jgi:hypothetical protein
LAIAQPGGESSCVLVTERRRDGGVRNWAAIFPLLIPRSLRTTSASFAGMSTHSRHPSIETTICHEYTICDYAKSNTDV